MAVAFCGETKNATSITNNGALSNECFLDGLSLLPHIFFILISVPILIAWNKSYYGSMHVKSWVHFPGHEARWALSAMLIVLNVAELGEGILSNSLYQGTHLHLILPHAMAIVGSCFSFFYYHYVELWNSPRFLLPLVGYWAVVLITKVLEFLYQLKVGLGPTFMRFNLNCTAIIIFLSFLVIELYVFLKLRYAVFPHHRKVRPPPELVETTYVQDYVSLPSRIFFHWVSRILIFGYKNTLERKDLGNLPPSESAATNFRILHNVLEEEKQKVSARNRQVSLWCCYLRAFWGPLALAGVSKLCGDMLTFIGPLCISRLIMFVETKAAQRESADVLPLPTEEQYIDVETYVNHGYFLCVLLLVATVAQNSALQYHHHLVIRQGIRLRSALQVLIYRKSLHLTATAMTAGSALIGQAANLMSVDVSNVMMSFYMGHYVWALPLRVSITLVLLYYQLGYSALIAAAVLFTLCPVQYIIAKIFARIQKQTLATSDERLRYVTEMLTAVKLIKLCAWEKLFSGRITKVRAKHLRLLLKGSCLSALTGFVTHGTPVLITLLAFVLYPHMEHQPLTSSRAFVSLALFDILGQPLMLFPMVVNHIVNAVVSTRRIRDFLAAPEVAITTPMPQEGTLKPQDIHVEISLQTTDHQGPRMVNGKHKRASSAVEFGLPMSPECSAITAAKSKHRKRSSASCCEYEEDAENSKMLIVAVERKRPRSVGNLLTVNLYDGPYTSKNNRSEGGRRARTMSGSHMLPKKAPSAHNVSSVSTHMSTKSPSVSTDQLSEQRRPLLEVVDGTFCWDWENDKPDLEGVNININAGVLTMIVGPVGSGKSSLLSAMLGEMRCLSGAVKWHGQPTKAYAGQIPWLLNDSLQNNILFGRPMDKKRYRRVLHACALNPDISILPAGDQTEIGEKGINLSGGQKHRVSLARAIYSHAEVVILDDPFSALDTHVVTHIFEAGIMKMLLRRHCSVIMVTHHLQYLKHAQTILTFAEGSLTQVDNLDDLKVSHPDLYDAHQAQSVSIDRVDDVGEELGIDVERRCLQHHMSTREFQRHLSTSQLDIAGQSASRTENNLVSTSPRQVFYAGQMTDFSPCDETCDPVEHITERRVSHAEIETSPSSCHTTPEKEPTELTEKMAEAGQLIEAEERQEGSVSVSVYWSYIKACSIGLAALVIGLHIAVTSTHMATDFWLAKWSSASTNNFTELNVTQADYDTEIAGYIRGYIALALTTVTLSLVVAFACEMVGLLAASRLHRDMMKTILKAPMRFFDVTPIGRIINRFSGDTFTIDDKLPSTIDGMFRVILLCLSAIFVNAIATPFFLLAAVPILVVYFFLQKFYRASSRELARLDSISKSPIVAHFTETLGGLSTIRAYRDTERFQRGILKLIDTNATIYLWLNTCNRWLGVRLDHLGALVVFAAAACLTTSASLGYINSGMVGLGITYALMVAHYLNWVVRLLADTEMQMNAVERIIHYTHLKGEDFGQGEVSVPKSWPEEGAIEFEDVALRYADTLEPAVREVTLSIKGGEKVGICGRTGSGKSSLTLGLFRLNDLVEGQILIDGVNIHHVALETLRARLSIIPQDPVLFSGTIRFNLDLYGEKSDEALWQALEISQLKSSIEQLDGQLDAEVQDGGGNFSVGQRQLFCLARAFLRDSRILIMDEATASVDMETDQLIQNVLGTSFTDRTVLIIAHRVSTITNCDTILVLDSGKVIEHDTPQNLLANEDSTFYSLVKGNK